MYRLPDFIGVGPPRTATTWLHEALLGHVGLPDEIKETDFFRWQYDKGLEWYASLFRNGSPGRPMGEFSPNYFAAEQARERIARDIPNCKIICTLRDPVERLYSNYRKMYEQAYFVGTFEDSLVQRADLLEWSMYARNVQAWQDRFGQENVLVLLHDDLKRDQQKFLDAVCDFIGAKQIILPDRQRKSDSVNAVRNRPRSIQLARATRKIRDRLELGGHFRLIALFKRLGLRDLLFSGGAAFPALSPETEARLRKFYAPEVEKLELMLNRDLSNWKDSSAHRRSTASAEALARGEELA